MRDTKPGEKHFTASVWLLTKTLPKRVLLIYHKKHNSWIQPGGHIEKFENPIEAAIREIKEEIGIDISQLQDLVIDDHAGTNYLPTPTYFLEETIPAHKHEPQHFHLDMMYVVEVSETQFRMSETETADIKWFTKEEAIKLDLFDNTRKVIIDLFNEKGNN